MTAGFDWFADAVILLGSAGMISGGYRQIGGDQRASFRGKLIA
jgi:hypothetical protein